MLSLQLYFFILIFRKGRKEKTIVCLNFTLLHSVRNNTQKIPEAAEVSLLRNTQDARVSPVRKRKPPAKIGKPSPATPPYVPIFLCLFLCLSICLCLYTCLQVLRVCVCVCAVFFLSQITSATARARARTSARCIYIIKNIQSYK